MIAGDGLGSEDPEAHPVEADVDGQSDQRGQDLEPERAVAQCDQAGQESGEHHVDPEQSHEGHAAAEPGQKTGAADLGHVPDLGHGPLAGLADAEGAPEQAEQADDQAHHAARVQRLHAVLAGQLRPTMGNCPTAECRIRCLQSAIVGEEEPEQGGEDQQQGKDRQETVIGDEGGQVAGGIVAELLDDPEEERRRPVSSAARRRRRWTVFWRGFIHAGLPHQGGPDTCGASQAPTCRWGIQVGRRRLWGTTQ